MGRPKEAHVRSLQIFNIGHCHHIRSDHQLKIFTLVFTYWRPDVNPPLFIHIINQEMLVFILLHRWNACEKQNKTHLRLKMSQRLKSPSRLSESNSDHRSTLVLGVKFCKNSQLNMLPARIQICNSSLTSTSISEIIFKVGLFSWDLKSHDEEWGKVEYKSHWLSSA